MALLEAFVSADYNTIANVISSKSQEKSAPMVTMCLFITIKMNKKTMTSIEPYFVLKNIYNPPRLDIKNINGTIYIICIQYSAPYAENPK